MIATAKQNGYTTGSFDLGTSIQFLVFPLLPLLGAVQSIDVNKVVATGVVPVIDGGLAGKDGGQIGAGILKAPLECFLAAAAALRDGG